MRPVELVLEDKSTDCVQSTLEPLKKFTDVPGMFAVMSRRCEGPGTQATRMSPGHTVNGEVTAVLEQA